MAEIWIDEEKDIAALLDEAGQYVELDGKLAAAYFICADGEDYVEANKDFLMQFLQSQNKYPLFLTFVIYEDQIDEYRAFLNEHGIEFTLTFLEEQRTYYTILGKHHYHPPCISAIIKDSDALKKLIDKTYWLPAENEFYTLSFSDNLHFELKEVVEWKRKKKRSIACFKIEPTTTFITIFHDGNGFYLFSNDQKYSPLKNLIAHLPKGTIITQINDTLAADMDNGYASLE